MRHLFLILCLCLGSTLAKAVDVNQIGKDLQGPGVVGWIHGSVEGQKIYVFTVRDPQNFFDYIEMSLVSDSPAIQDQLAHLNRHDQVRIKGAFLDIPAPQKHIDVQSIEMVKAYNSGIPVDPYQHEAKIPEDLLNGHEANFLVHAVAAGGGVLVLEYKDAVVPVFVAHPELSKDLYRGDVVHLKYKIQHSPKEPTHLNIDETAPAPVVQVLDSIKAQNGKKIEIQGRLILFPKSPEIMFNVFAVEQPLQDDLKRQFTLVNFDSPDLFKKILAILQVAWDRHPGAYVNGRNKLVSTVIQVKVSGTINEVDPSQANPQVLINKIEDLKIIE